MSLPKADTILTGGKVFIAADEGLAEALALWKGKVLPGMAADAAVFSRDLLAATPEEVRGDTRCDLTLLGGEPVHDRLGQWA